ncbi:hypothetical protein AN958_02281 [Leucoagaricus sp. SymC.cos]|nr:hypothetical protein AN958_02281 [Leucoagaricus sp. SymC.cos]
MDDLTNFIYPDIQLHQPDQYFLDRTVLSSRNDEVDDINAAILERFPGEKHVLMGADSIDLDNADNNNYSHLAVLETPPVLETLNFPPPVLTYLILKKSCKFVFSVQLHKTNILKPQTACADDNSLIYSKFWVEI